MKLTLLNRFIHLSYSALLFIGVFISPSITPVSRASQPAIAQGQSHSRTRIAILDFDLTDTSGNFFSYSFRGGSLARGISDLLTIKLVQDGSYSVVERSRIDAVLREQNFGATGRVDASTAAEIGRILGVEYVVLGSVTRFNLEENRSGGSVGICLPFVGCGVGASVTTQTANVELTARLVDTTTAEIVTAAEGVGEEEQRSGGAVIGGNRGSSNVDNTDNLISDAAEAAVENLVSELVGARTSRSATSTTTPTSPISTQSIPDALVADISENQIIINQGTQKGFEDGMVLSIERVNREVTDPETGEVIRTLTTPIGQIELTNVDARSGIGRIVSGSGFQIGDRARITQ